MVGDEGADGVLERVESGDESVEFSPLGTKDEGLGGLIVGRSRRSKTQEQEVGARLPVVEKYLGRAKRRGECLLQLIAHDCN
jgi:hypothetical protein